MINELASRSFRLAFFNLLNKPGIVIQQTLYCFLNYLRCILAGSRCQIAKQCFFLRGEMNFHEPSVAKQNRESTPMSSYI
jgi:hypothetical protein